MHTHTHTQRQSYKPIHKHWRRSGKNWELGKKKGCGQQYKYTQKIHIRTHIFVIPYEHTHSHIFSGGYADPIFSAYMYGCGAQFLIEIIYFMLLGVLGIKFALAFN